MNFKLQRYEDRPATIQEHRELRAEIERLRERLHGATAWLRAQANAEKEPKARAAFIEAHNAVLAIAEGRA